MACKDYNSLQDILTNFTKVSDAGICPYASDLGAGIGLGLFGLFVFTAVGLALTIRTRHPAPVIVGGILSSSVITVAIPGIAAKILALVLFVSISGLGVWLYSRARSTL